MNNINNSKPTRLSKVYFTWVIRDFGSAEWFHSLLNAIEEQDIQNRIEINIYLTATVKEDDVTNIMVRAYNSHCFTVVQSVDLGSGRWGREGCDNITQGTYSLW